MGTKRRQKKNVAEAERKIRREEKPFSNFIAGLIA